VKPRTMRRIYMREAALTLVLAKLAVRFISPRAIVAWADRPPRRIRRFVLDEIDWVLWAVDRIGAGRWMNAPSLERALAAHAILRRRGIASQFCLGVAGEEDRLTAHAWVVVSKDGVIGAVEAHGFRCLATFGGVS
jgi:hypothetical protein